MKMIQKNIWQKRNGGTKNGSKKSVGNKMPEKKVASNAVRNKTIKLTENMLLARRTGNLKKEQSELEKMKAFCEKENIDYKDAFDFGKSWLKKNKISPCGAW